MTKVICVSIRETNPKQIAIGEEYWMDENSLYTDDDGDKYAMIYKTAEDNATGYDCIGIMKLSHFHVTTIKSIWFGRNKKGIWKASFDKSHIDKLGNLTQCKIDANKIHDDKVYMCVGYYGYVYDADVNKFGKAVEDNSIVYHSVNAARNSAIWTKAEKYMEQHPENPYYNNKFCMRSNDENEKFNIRIIGVKIV